VQPVGVLGRVDGQHGLVEVEATGHRVLDDEGIDGAIGVELRHRGQQVGLGRIGRDLLVERDQPVPLAHLVLLGDIASGGGIVADEDRSESHRRASRAQRLYPLADLGVDRVGHRRARHHDRSHQCWN
jgi:hypothetical protein